MVFRDVNNALYICSFEVCGIWGGMGVVFYISRVFYE